MAPPAGVRRCCCWGFLPTPWARPSPSRTRRSASTPRWGCGPDGGHCAREDGGGWPQPPPPHWPSSVRCSRSSYCWDCWACSSAVRGGARCGIPDSTRASSPGGASSPRLASLVVALRRAREPTWRYLVWMSVPLLAFAVVLAVPGQAKPHWPTPAYTVLAIALGVLWPAWWQRRRVLLAVAAGLNALLIVGVAAVALAPGRIQIEGTTQGWDRAARIIYQEAAAREAVLMG